MKKEIKSFVDINLMDMFPSGYPNKNFFNYVSNKVGLEGFLAVSGILMPDLVENNGCIFLAENYPVLNDGFNCRFGNDTKTLERYVNLFCLSDFYLLSADEAAFDSTLLLNQANIIKQFWTLYFEHKFPDRKFVVEVFQNGLYDEDGICITFWQE